MTVSGRARSTRPPAPTSSSSPTTSAGAEHAGEAGLALVRAAPGGRILGATGVRRRNAAAADAALRPRAARPVRPCPWIRAARARVRAARARAVSLSTPLASSLARRSSACRRRSRRRVGRRHRRRPAADVGHGRTRDRRRSRADPGLWPPGPYALASAAARVAEALCSGSRRQYSCFVDVGRGRIAAMPVVLTRAASRASSTLR